MRSVSVRDEGYGKWKNAGGIEGEKACPCIFAISATSAALIITKHKRAPHVPKTATSTRTPNNHIYTPNLMLETKAQGGGDPVLVRQRPFLQPRVTPLVRGVREGHGDHVV